MDCYGVSWRWELFGFGMSLWLSLFAKPSSFPAGGAFPPFHNEMRGDERRWDE